MLTQEELAERARLSVRTVRNLEAGHIRRPRSGSIRLLAAALGLSEQERVLLAELAERESDPAKPAASGGGWPAGPWPPRLLPAVVADFTGRHQQVAALLALLERDGGPGGAAGLPNATAVAVISGSAGVGKTALAVHTAHLLGDRFPDGHLFVNLRGYDPAGPLEPARALAGLLYGWAWRPSRYRSRSRRPPGCTERCWPTGACWSCWTTPAAPTRSGRYCPAPARRSP
jgi:hypothetical protein